MYVYMWQYLIPELLLCGIFHSHCTTCIFVVRYSSAIAMFGIYFIASGCTCLSTIYTHPHILTSSHPHTLTHAYPHTLTYSPGEPPDPGGDEALPKGSTELHHHHHPCQGGSEVLRQREEVCHLVAMLSLLALTASVRLWCVI